MPRRPGRRASDEGHRRVIVVETQNRSGVAVGEAEAAEVARHVLAAEGVESGELGIVFVAPAEIQALKREHLGIDEPTDVLSFPLDGREPVPEGVPRALGDVVICPQVVGDEWRWPLTHGLLHVLGYDHGDEMEAREQELLA
jgi:probable rRNA maturation factor